MKVLSIFNLLGELGAKFSRNEIPKMEDYFSKMIADGRFVAIYDNDKLCGILTFSVCDNYDEFCKDSSWDYQPHYPNGKKVFIEIMACKKWNKEIRRLFELKIADRFPQFEEGAWLRGQRVVRVKRRNYAKV